jgi:hypothetical protein
MTARALIKEADMMRAIRAAKKLGATRVSILKDGTIVFDIYPEENQPTLPIVQPSEPLVTIDDRPKKRLVF